MIIFKKRININSTPYELIPQWGRIPLFAFLTLFIFFSLKYSFLLYVGLLDPKGYLTLPILEKYSLIQLILNLLIYPTKFILTVLGFETTNTFNSIKIVGSGGVRIAFPCLGAEIIFSLVSLIIAYPGNKKLNYILGGIVGVLCINILRVTGLTLLNNYDSDLSDPGHIVFNTTGYIFILILFYWWVKNNSADLIFSKN